MSGGRALLLAAALAACGVTPQGRARRPEPVSRGPATVTRVSILPSPLGTNDTLGRPHYVGSYGQQSVWDVGGLRLTYDRDGVRAAPIALPGFVRAGSVDASGVWLFLLADGHVFRAPDALGTPELLGRVMREHRSARFARHAFAAQSGGLAFADHGEGYVIDGELPPRRLEGLPSGMVERIGSFDGTILARLTGGATFASGGDGSWHAIRRHPEEWDEAPTPPAPGAPELLAAILREHPSLSPSLGVPLGTHGSVVAADAAALLHVGPDREVRVLPVPWNVDSELGAWEGHAVLNDGRQSWLTDDGVHIVASDGAWLEHEQRLVCEEDGAPCVVGLDGTHHRVEAEGSFPEASSRWVAIARDDGTHVHPLAAEGVGAERAVLPATERPRIRGDAVVVGRSLWTPTLGVTELPEGTTHAATFGDGSVLAWGEELPSLRLHRGEGSWMPLAADAPPIRLYEQARCTGARCTLFGFATIVAVDVGDEIAALVERVARLEDDAYAPPLRIPRILRGGAGPFASLDLRCVTRPGSAPRGTAVRELSWTTPSAHWLAGRARAGARRINPPELRGVLGDARNALLVVDDRLADLTAGGAFSLVARDVRSFDGISLGDGSWLVVTGHLHDGRYRRWQPDGTPRLGELNRFSAAPGCYGLARRGGTWGALLCTQHRTTAAFLSLQDPGMPVPVEIGALDDTNRPPMPVCARAPTDIARIPVSVQWSEYADAAIVELGIDDAPCVWRVEPMHDTASGTWRSPGALEADDGVLRGTLRLEHTWEAHECRPSRNAT